MRIPKPFTTRRRNDRKTYLEQILSIKMLDQLLAASTFDHDSPDEKGRLNYRKFLIF